MPDKAPDDVSPEEAERVAREAIKRSFSLPHQPNKALTGKPVASDAQAKRRSKDHPKD